MPSAALTALVLVTALAAVGCLSGTPGDDPLLQETVEVGTPLFGWGEGEHFGPQPMSNVKRINAHSVEVTQDLQSIGLSFQGSFIWANSTATLRVERGDGSIALELEAREGLEDDAGTIHTLFEFTRVVPAEPGTWRAVAEGRGNISTMDLRIHGIPSEATSIERTFTVDRADRDIRLRIEGLAAFGEPPKGALVAPDGTTTPFEFAQARGGVAHEWTAQRGEHRLTLETTGWGGHMSIRVTKV